MMEIPNRKVPKGLWSASVTTASGQRKRRRLGGDRVLALRGILVGLIASLVVAVPGWAQEYGGNHEFRGNAVAKAQSTTAASVSAGVTGTSGAANMSIPIGVPPGPGGLAPTLSLNYSSVQGDGPFGLGWNLQLGEIRCTARFGVPDYANCPEYELDGQLLVGPDAQGRYHTQVESFQKIVWQSGGEYWEVTAPGGTRRLYGELNNSKIGPDGLPPATGAPTARWLLSKIIDIHGNEIAIVYDRSDLGIAYPSTITYAIGERVVSFVYEARPDEIFDFPGGIPRNITKRLHEIVVTSVGGIFSRRVISYSAVGDYATQRSRIASTQLFGKGCTDITICPSLPAETFLYTETNNDPIWKSRSSWHAGLFVKTGLQTGSYDQGKRLADVNGDGLPDIVDGYCADPANCAGPGILLNDGSGWVGGAGTAAWTAAIQSLTYDAPTVTVESVDYTGGTRACNATPGTVTRKIAFASGARESQPIAVNGNFETYTPWPSWHLVDVNGDGFADLISSTRGGVVMRELDCEGNSHLDQPPDWWGPDFEPVGGQVSQKIFLNNGSATSPGWTEASVEMTESLPLFMTQTIIKHADDFNSTISRRYCDYLGVEGDVVPGDNYCMTWMDFRPEFVELNGDGLIDIIVLGELPLDTLWMDYFDPLRVEVRGSGSVAYVQKADGSGWELSSAHGPPVVHMLVDHVANYWTHGGGMHPYDPGVRFVDLNRDGLTDIVKDRWGQSGGHDVLLNTGTGWCDDLGDRVGMPCDPVSDPNSLASRFEPPLAFNEYFSGTTPVSRTNGLVFADLNGDGWVDLMQGKNEPSGTPDTMEAWLHDPGATGATVWIPQNAQFKPLTPFYAGTQFADLDGNGTTDILHGWEWDNWSITSAFLSSDSGTSPVAFSDLLDSVDNGRGGITDFTYVSAAVQQDDAMEADAESEASIRGDADGSSAVVTRFTSTPVVSESTVSGVGIAANVTTQYRYARPRFDPVEHSSLGFGLVETTRPDGSRVDAYAYQRTGLVGRPALQSTFDEAGNEIHRFAQNWVLAPNPGSIPGAMDGVDVPRLWIQVSFNVYGADQFGAVASAVNYYDDTYGYNFIWKTLANRPTGGLTTTYTPDLDALDEAKWLVGLVDVKEQLSGLTVLSREVYDYTENGQLESRARDIGLRDGTAAIDIATTSWTYDSWGNLKTQTESRGKDAADTLLSPRVVEFCYDGDGGGGGNWCPSLPGGTSETHSLRVGAKDAIGGVVEFKYDWTTGSVLGVERQNESGDFRDSMTVVRDLFGRVTEKWFRGASFGGGDLDVQLSAATYQDAPNGAIPAYVEDFRYTEEGGIAPIRTARYLDGFGGSFRTVEETPTGYRGTAVLRNPVTRITRSVGPIDCDAAAACSGITEATEPFTEQEVDEVGRPVRTTTPDGEVLTAYQRIERAQPLGDGSPEWFDAIEIRNSEGQMIRRLMDGNRVVWVDECLDMGCVNTPDSTFYTYEATGEISTIYDAIATSTPDFTSPARYLRYHYDTLGRVIQTDEPNTGSSSAKYDHQGNLTAAANVRNMTTRTYYDPLGRVTSIDRPAGVGEWDLDFTYDPISRKRDGVTTPDSEYEDAWEYDDFGRATRQTRSYYDAMVMDFDYDLLGRPTKIDYPSTGSSATYGYEGAYLTEVCRGEVVCASTALRYRLITDVVYDDLGRREDVVMPSGTVHREYYGTGAEAGRSVNALKRLAITTGAAAGALDFNYEYDSIGNIESIDDQSSTYDGSATYTYDARNRLESWTDASGVHKLFDYDALGNLVKHGDVDQVFDIASKPHQIVSNRVGEGYEYDPDGNVKKRGSTFFVYNSANQLVCTGSAEGVCDGPGYRYDADGQLLWDGAAGQQLMGDLFKWQSQGNTAYSNIVAFGEVITEVKQARSFLRSGWAPIAWPLPIPKAPFFWMLAGAGMLSLLALLAWLGAGSAFSESPATATAALVLAGLLVVPPPAWGMGGGRRRTVTTVRNFFRDHLGSAAYITGPNVRQAYEPFGKPILTPTGADDEFTSKEYHGATEMYNFGARWYDAEAGRFAGVDPLVSDTLNSQSLNAYSYVENDPVNRIDPTGMASCAGFNGGCYTVTPSSSGPMSKPFTPKLANASFGFSRASPGGTIKGVIDYASQSSSGTECCSSQSEGGDLPQGEDTPYDLAAAGPDAIDQLRRLADSVNLIDAMKEAEREVERLWVDGKKNGKEKYADDDAWAWKGMHFQREPNNPFLEAFDHWSVEVVRTPAGTPRDSVPEPRPLSIGSGGVKWIRPPTKIYCANCPSRVGF